MVFKAALATIFIINNFNQMQKFSYTSLLALSVAASYQEINIRHDGTIMPKYFKNLTNEEHIMSEANWTVSMPANSLIVLQDKDWDGQEYAYKPSLNGGSFAYWAQMTNMNASCVAGVYLVALNSACDIESA